MTTTDQAFIRAYLRDDPEPMPPAPHVPTFAPPSPVATVEEPYGAEASRHESAGQLPPEPEYHAPQPETAQQDDYRGITNYVPPPHIDMAAGFQPRDGRRNPLPVGGSGHAQPERQPLSSFATTAPRQESAEPALEVDQLYWSEVTFELAQRIGEDLDAGAKRLAELTSMGSKVIAVAGLHSGVGCTTMMLTLAQRLGRFGVGTVLVDAHFARPAVATQLGLAMPVGWEAVLAGELPLAEAMVVSTRDRLTVVPLANPIGSTEPLKGGVQVSICFGVLRSQYPLVLVDAGPILGGDSSVLSLTGRAGIDAALVVCDARRPYQAELVEAVNLLATAGIAPLAVLENFSRPTTRPATQAAAHSTPLI